jgi:hypothetical protein
MNHRHIEIPKYALSIGVASAEVAHKDTIAVCIQTIYGTIVIILLATSAIKTIYLAAHRNYVPIRDKMDNPSKELMR